MATTSALDELRRSMAVVEEPRARLALVNELLDDLDHELTRNGELPRQLGWIALAGGIGLAMLSRLQPSWEAALACVVVGLAGGAACRWAGRRARVCARQQRERVDQAVAEAVGSLYDAEIVLPKRREMRWKRRRK